MPDKKHPTLEFANATYLFGFTHPLHHSIAHFKSTPNYYILKHKPIHYLQPTCLLQTSVTPRCMRLVTSETPQMPRSKRTRPQDRRRARRTLTRPMTQVSNPSLSIIGDGARQASRCTLMLLLIVLHKRSLATKQY